MLTAAVSLALQRAVLGATQALRRLFQLQILPSVEIR